MIVYNIILYPVYMFQRLLGLDVPCARWRGDGLRGCVGGLHTLVLLVSNVITFFWGGGWRLLLMKFSLY